MSEHNLQAVPGDTYAAWYERWGRVIDDVLDNEDVNHAAFESHDAEIERLRAVLDRNPWSDKVAPVQGLASGIPWEMHLRAYDVYCKRYSPQKALIEGNCRGGFAVSELDAFIPGWRDELDQRTQLNKEIERLRADLAEAIDTIQGLAEQNIKLRRDASALKRQQLLREKHWTLNLEAKPPRRRRSND